MSSYSQYSRPLVGVTSTIMVLGLFYILYQNDYLDVQPLPATQPRAKRPPTEEELAEARAQKEAIKNAKELSALPFQRDAAAGDGSAWGSFIGTFNNFSIISDEQWNAFSQTVAGYSDYIMPDWAKVLPGYIDKLRRELNMAPGSLADDIWKEAQDPDINPEINYSASVRVSNDLCDEEKAFLDKRKIMTKTALARYLGLPDESIHPDDVPRIAMVGSGGGLRALVAGTGSMLAADEDGLFDCITYTAGVSGSCWLQSLFNSSLGGRRLDRLVEHLKARIGIHIASPVDALTALNSAPTNKFLLSGFVEKLKGDRNAEFGLVDVYGLLLAARLLVPKGELGVDDRDLKISNQRDYINNGENPMPIYTAVRHEIPILEEDLSEQEKQTEIPSEATKEKAVREAWFEWFEITPYEMFCEEFGAGIPTWALGRKFEGGKDIPHEETGLRIPELRLPLLLGIFGSAFCATLSHYYREVRPLVKGLMGFGSIDDMIAGRNEDLSKVHPIDPASIPNFAYGMKGQLPETAPESIYQSTHLKLMDAGMSNNLPIYPLLRPGREVDVLIAFDASADVKTDNWLSVVDGYARQRGIKGWPIGVGWPKSSDSAEKTEQQLDQAQVSTAAEAETKLEKAQEEQATHLERVISSEEKPRSLDAEDSGDLGYCTVWVGTTEERVEEEPPLSKAVKEDWQLMEPDAGIAVVYLPFLANPKVEGVDPAISDYMSTWNFVYSPDDIDHIVELAKANFAEGKEQIRRTVRAVYERKKRIREGRERKEREERFRRKVRLGVVGKKGEGDHFHLT